VLPRFFAPDASRHTPVVNLSEDETTHLTRVLRLRPGAAVHLFDGRGNAWRGEFVHVTKKRASVRLLERVAAAAEPQIPIALAISVLKSDKMDDVVRDAVMLGVTAIQPLLTDRAETSSASLSRAKRVDRWQRIAVASAKQCGRAVVPLVTQPVTLAAALSDRVDGARLMFVEPQTSAAPSRLRDVPRPQSATLVLGPEGGWSEDELRSAEHAGVSLVTMGGLTLRADAMPVVALTAVRTQWEDF
jgi:16S rRNA (uracil1498-N3)-methyltransferase